MYEQYSAPPAHGNMPPGPPYAQGPPKAAPYGQPPAGSYAGPPQSYDPSGGDQMNRMMGNMQLNSGPPKQTVSAGPLPLSSQTNGQMYGGPGGGPPPQQQQQQPPLIGPPSGQGYQQNAYGPPSGGDTSSRPPSVAPFQQQYHSPPQQQQQQQQPPPPQQNGYYSAPSASYGPPQTGSQGPPNGYPAAGGPPTLSPSGPPPSQVTNGPSSRPPNSMGPPISGAPPTGPPSMGSGATSPSGPPTIGSTGMPPTGPRPPMGPPGGPPNSVPLMSGPLNGSSSSGFSSGGVQNGGQYTGASAGNQPSAYMGSPQMGGSPNSRMGAPPGPQSAPQYMSGPSSVQGPPSGPYGANQGSAYNNFPNSAPPMGSSGTYSGGMMPGAPQQNQQSPSGGYPQGGPPSMGAQYPPGPRPPMQNGPQQQQPQPWGAQQGYQYPPQPAAQAPRKLDPETLPSPIQVIEDDRKTKGGEYLTNKAGQIPPLVTTDFQVQDGGICSPRFIRSTIYNVPTAPDMLRQTSVPFALAVSPLAKNERPLPVSVFGESGPVRCDRCKAYMCPFMQFIDGGRRFQCPFCKATSEVAQDYFNHLDHTGQRVDKYQRAELCLGSYEILATKEYCKNETFPKPPAFIFLLDVSYNSVRTGLVHLFCNNIKQILTKLPREEGQANSALRVGFITYSSVVHFYNINPSLDQPQMMVVPDVNDMFVPFLDGCLVPHHEAATVIDALIEQIPQMFMDTRETETILGPAIQAGMEALKAAECAGKLFVFHTSLPIADAPGRLKNRDDRKLLGSDKEKTILIPQTTFYNTLGKDCVAASCSVDLFLFHNAFVDIATIGQIAKVTGGQVYKYTYFQSQVDGGRFLMDLERAVSGDIAFDAVMRVRTSQGIRPTDFFGNFYMANTTDVELAAVDADKCIAVEIKYDDKLPDDENAYIQVALLYTTHSGQRRLRIHNLALQTCNQMADLFRSCELDAIMNFIGKQSLSLLMDSTPRQIREAAITKAATILAAYRKNCATPSSTGQLILPECMKLLPLYTNCLLKCDALSGGQEMSVDDRAFAMLSLASMDVKTSQCYFYPRLIPLHDVDLEADDIPVSLRCSIEKVQESGAYLLENGIYMFLYVGAHCSPEFIHDVFAVPSIQNIDIEKTVLPEISTSYSKRIRGIIRNIMDERPRSMRLSIVRQGDKLELVFRQFLVEDRHSDIQPSYVDFLCHLHKEIRNLIS